MKQPNELSGFGFPEAATPVEICVRDDCSHSQPLVTDLYCRNHGRFLPLIKAPVWMRIVMAIIASLIIYGSLELAAQRDSQLPVFIVYAAIFLGFVALPLRHFARTAVIASLIWAVACIIPIISHTRSGHSHVMLAAAALVGGIAILTIYAIANAPRTELPRSLTREVRVIARVVSMPLIIAAWSAVATLALHYERYILPGSEPRVARITLIIALACLAVSALIVSASSVVIGVRNMKLHVKTLPKPRRPIWVAPKVRRISPRNYRARNALDLAIETFTRTVYQIAVSVANTLVVIGRIVANCTAQLVYVLTYAIVTLINILIRFAVLTARWVQATIASVARLSFYAAFIACRSIFDPIVSVLIPVSALIGAPWLVLAAANETRLYLLYAPLTALRSLSIMVLTTTALLLGTWVILANQHPRESFRSFERSAPISIAYGLVILFVGGLLLGLPRAFGYGHIHIGRVTLSLTGVVIIAFLISVIKSRVGSKANRQSAPSSVGANSSPSPDTGGRGWTVTVALVMIVGAVTGLVVFVPWTNLPVAQPTGLAADNWTVNSVTISWSGPSSGPLATSYVIMQNGKEIGSVPGTANSYNATKLAPDTAYTYLVIAVRGAHRSAWSSAMTAHTRIPQVWTALLTGQWTVHYTQIDWNGLNSSPVLTTDSWTFAPECTTSRCPVDLTGEIDNAQFTSTLHRSGALYTSEASDSSYFTCGSTPATGDLILRISALKGEVIGGQWVVSSWSGTMTLSTPASDCTAARITANISAAK